MKQQVVLTDITGSRYERLPRATPHTHESHTSQALIHNHDHGALSRDTPVSDMDRETEPYVAVVTVISPLLSSFPELIWAVDSNLHPPQSLSSLASRLRLGARGRVEDQPGDPDSEDDAVPVGADGGGH